MKRLLLIFALASTVLASAQKTPILIHGNESTNHFKIYVIADGFTSSNMPYLILKLLA